MSVTSVAVPKYSLPALTMSEFRPSSWVAFCALVVTAAAVAVAALASRPEAITKARVSLAILPVRCASLFGF